MTELMAGDKLVFGRGADAGGTVVRSTATAGPMATPAGTGAGTIPALPLRRNLQLLLERRLSEHREASSGGPSAPSS